MTKVISFSLWGDNPRYTEGAIANAALAQEIYPDWECHFYVSRDVRKEVADKLRETSQVKTLYNLSNWGWNCTMWRFFSASEADVFISRDTDSRLSYREKAAVDDWLASDKDFHIMRDHPYHAVPILAGMWGCRNGVISNVREMIHEFVDSGRSKQEKQNDQIFLAERVYGLVERNSMIHDPYFERNPFPWGVRDPKFFVGQAYAGDGKILDDEGYFQDYIKKEREEYAKSFC